MVDSCLWPNKTMVLKVWPLAAASGTWELVKNGNSQSPLWVGSRRLCFNSCSRWSWCMLSSGVSLSAISSWTGRPWVSFATFPGFSGRTWHFLGEGELPATLILLSRPSGKLDCSPFASLPHQERSSRFKIRGYTHFGHSWNRKCWHLSTHL